MQNISYFIIPSFIIIVFLYSLKNKSNAYDSFIIGVKDGVKTTFSIMPYLVSMYIGVSVFVASGFVQDIISIRYIPVELLLQSLFKPVSANASMAFMFKIFEYYTPDSKEGIAASLLQGGTDTTIYVMSLYFGSIGVTKSRYAIPVGLLTDLFCFILVLICFFIIL